MVRQKNGYPMETHSRSRHNNYGYPNIYVTWVYKFGDFLMEDKDKNKFPNMRVTFVQRLTNVLLRISNPPPSLPPQFPPIPGQRQNYLVLELPCCKSTLLMKELGGLGQYWRLITLTWPFLNQFQRLIRQNTQNKI